MSQYKGISDSDDNYMDWSVWDWQLVKHRDLFVMMQVGQKTNGIVWGGFFGGFPYQYKYDNGSVSKSYYFETDIQFMHKIEKTNVLTSDKLIQAIPEVDWLHGHSGELLSVESAEKLGMLLFHELRKLDDSDMNVYFDSYNEQQYVLKDILTFMCTELKNRLYEKGKNKSKRIRNIHNLMVTFDNDDYKNWINWEDHLSLEKLNDILL